MIETLASDLGLARISVVAGGPSIADPEGRIAKYVGFRDKKGNGFRFALDHEGVIIEAGASIGGRSYRIPVEETLR